MRLCLIFRCTEIACHKTHDVFANAYMDSYLKAIIRVCEYVMRLVACDFSVFLNIMRKRTRIRTYSSLDFDILRIRTRIRIRAYGFLA